MPHLTLIVAACFPLSMARQSWRPFPTSAAGADWPSLRFLLPLCLLLLLSAPASAELSHGYFADGQQIDVWANSLRSPRKWDPVDYASTPLCIAQPITERPLSWGQGLAGDRLYLTPIEVCTAHCAMLCG